MLCLMKIQDKDFGRKMFGDYRFYRQDSSGYWSHKQGSTPISNVDASGNAIWDPTICDRGSYPAVYGYYEITEWGMLYEG